MKLRARYTALFAILAAATVVVLVLVLRRGRREGGLGTRLRALRPGAGPSRRRPAAHSGGGPAAEFLRGVGAPARVPHHPHRAGRDGARRHGLPAVARSPRSRTTRIARRCGRPPAAGRATPGGSRRRPRGANALRRPPAPRTAASSGSRCRRPALREVAGLVPLDDARRDRRRRACSSSSSAPRRRRRFSRPIAELTRSASAIAAGDFARDLPALRWRGSADCCPRRVQRMKDSLITALERAEGERRLTAMVFETLPDGLVVVDAKLRVLESNGRFAVMAGVPAPAGRGVYELLRETPALRMLRNHRAHGGDSRSGRSACPTTASGRSRSPRCRTGIGPPPSACCATSRGSRRPSPCAGPSSATSRTSCGRRSRRSRRRRRRWPKARPTRPRARSSWA